ncbi:MAG: polymerase sigma factor CnrH [Verrucomicrobiota bacterium]|jgi:RNA polymerase sigma-70 factor (ECF subfamily)
MPPPDPTPDLSAAYENFVRCLTQHEPALRRFIRTLLPSWADVDEVMQRTALVAWKKFEHFEAGSEFLRWGMVIARYEALAYRRSMGRERLCFSNELLELMEREGEEEEIHFGQREAVALEGCLQKLPKERREMVLRAYAAGADQREVAASLGKSSGAFYMLLARIRKDLAHCIASQMKEA